MIQKEVIPLYLWIIGFVGIVGVVINLIRLWTKINQPLTLVPQANLRQLPKEDPLYQSLLSIENQPINQVYQICLNQYQKLLICKYLPKIFLCVGLIVIPIAYFLSEWIITQEWDDSIIIIVGTVILPISWSLAFLSRFYSLILLGLLSSWVIYALSLSGRIFYPDTLLWFAILVCFICVGITSIAGNHQTDEHKEQFDVNSMLGTLAFSIVIIFALSLVRYFLPFVGSFTILLVVPAIFLLCITDGISCVVSLLAIPLLITSAIAERYWFVFPNSLLVACFLGLNIFLLLNVLISIHQVKKSLEKIRRYVDLAPVDYPPFPCQDCGTGMEYIDNLEIDDYLSYPQQVARSIDSMQYLAWYCPRCNRSSSAIHLRGYIHGKRYNDSGSWFEDCPTCNELTMVCSQTLRRESLSQFLGIKVKNQNFHIERECACCNLVDSRSASKQIIH